MINTGGHDLPSQIAMQMHYRVSPEKSHGLLWAGRDKQMGEIATFMDLLWRYGGYFLIDRVDPPTCETCTNVLLVRHIGQSEHEHVHAAHDPLPGQYRHYTRKSDL